MGSVELRKITKSYGATKVLHDIDISVEDGEFVVLVGPSGCGKSTTLRILAGLEEATTGDILIANERVNDRVPKDRDIAMVFQNYALYPHMTVADNMAFSMRLAGKSKAEKDEKVLTAARILGLEDLLDRFPRQLSGGQRQRVAMGRAIVRNPKVFLFDEPLSNLDAKLRVSMREEIKILHQRLGTTIVYVTHDQIEAMTLADKIVILRDGRVEQIGSPLALFDEPRNTFVAGFIGSPNMNLLEARIEKGVVSVGNGQALADCPKDVTTTGDVTVGVRPDDFELDAGGMPAEVILTEHTGSEIYIVASINGARVHLSLRDRVQVQPGDKIGLRVPPERLHLFDRQTGQRINGPAVRHSAPAALSA